MLSCGVIPRSCTTPTNDSVRFVSTTVCVPAARPEATVYVSFALLVERDVVGPPSTTTAKKLVPLSRRATSRPVPVKPMTIAVPGQPKRGPVGSLVSNRPT